MIQKSIYRVVLLVVVVLAVGASSASAHTTIIEPEGSHYPYQQWIDEAEVPTPDVTLMLIEAPCPGEEDTAYACTSPAEHKIWFNLALTEGLAPRPQAILYHEIGHNFDFYDLSEWGRLRFRELRHSKRPWSDLLPFEGLEEVFADSYAGCGLQWPGSRYMPGHPWEVYAPRVCRLIESAYQRP